jgi:hypothetical protein
MHNFAYPYNINTTNGMVTSYVYENYRYTDRYNAKKYWITVTKRVECSSDFKINKSHTHPKENDDFLKKSINRNKMMSWFLHTQVRVRGDEHWAGCVLYLALNVKCVEGEAQPCQAQYWKYTFDTYKWSYELIDKESGSERFSRSERTIGKKPYSESWSPGSVAKVSFKLRESGSRIVELIQIRTLKYTVVNDDEWSMYTVKEGNFVIDV